ncbi:hypothetical protein GCM10007860_26140 [Chitiniphilus shinanonensis]|uniref:Uncharacterized protein n=2 Tax=Chitiniphilus shinanonensis TaxID=553088 RepID=A0ABQ6BVS4_9NEIS|nr:hypothetical protein GCM10007860_26140 [Chitiniphilus shinanonensis]
MKTKLFNPIIFATALLAAAFSSQAEAGMDYSKYNLLGNYGFENGAALTAGLSSGWINDKSAGYTSFQLVTSVPYEGTTAQLMSFSALNSGKWARLYQEVPITPNRQYYASSFVRVQALNGARFEMRLELLDDSGAVIQSRSTDWYLNQSLTAPTNGWTNLKMNGMVPANAVKARLAFRAIGVDADSSGTVLIDAVQLSQTQMQMGRFELNNLSEFDKVDANEGALIPSDSVARSGKKSLAVQLRNTDPLVSSGKRAELSKLDIGENGKSYAYGFSLYLPTDWKSDTSSEGIAQWHVTGDPGDVARSPSLALMIQGDKWIVAKRWDDQAISTSNSLAALHYEVIYEAPLNKGKWEDWAFEVRWDYRPQAAGGTGYTRVWRNGVLVASVNAPNSYNDQNQKYFKIGLYKWDWNNGAATQTTYRKLYIDDVRITDSGGTHLDVMP